MKALFVVFDLKATGGVSNFYRMLQPHFDKKSIDYFVNSMVYDSKFYKTIMRLFDICRFFCYLLFFRYNCVLLNPSLSKNAVVRDGVYCFIAKRIFRKKVYVLWHGWDLKYEKRLEEKLLSRFRFFYFNADGMMTLASPFRDKLVEWGYNNPIQLVTTAAEDSYVNLPRTYHKEPPLTLLFLSRIEENKGIFLALESVRIVQQDMGLPLRFIVAGDGSALTKAKKRAAELNLVNVVFTGYIRGKEKENILQEADLFFFPTFYGEGMPCALLEAMATGLPFITTNVGGIPDLFHEGKMGFMLNTLEPHDFAEKIREFLEKPELIEYFGRYNHEFAKKNICASQVAANLEHIILESTVDFPHKDR